MEAEIRVMWPQAQEAVAQILSESLCRDYSPDDTLILDSWI